VLNADDRLADDVEEGNGFGDVRAAVGAVVATGPTMVFQPIVDLRSGRVLGAEALARFPDGVRPDVWFGRAASVGLGLALELAAVRIAVARIEDLPPGTYLSVNASPALVESGQLAEAIAGPAARRIVVEITEHATVGDVQAFEAGVAALRVLGARLAIDDVGAGFASFQQVLRLRPEIVKLDISLTRAVDVDPARRALVTALVSFCRDVGGTLVAEGVETQAELDALVALGVGAAQGYVFARPGALPLPAIATRPTSRIGGVERGSTPFERVAEAWRQATDLETLARPLLDTVIELTGLEVAYVTVKHADDSLEHRFIADPTGLGLPEGFTIPWDDSICKRCQENDLRWTADVPNDVPGSPAAEAFGVQTFLSVPVASADGGLMGTLCGASLDARYVSAATLSQLEVLARLVGDWMQRERELELARRRADDAERALAARAELVAAAEHQLKTPLSLIAGWATSLGERWDEIPDESRRHGVAVVRAGADRLASDLERLLDEARTDLRSRTLEVVPLDVAGLARDAAEDLAVLAVRHDVSCSAPHAAVAMAEEEAVSQVLAHLLENALKYSPAGGAIAVTVATEADEVVLRVSDEGIGIAEGVDLFHPFTRGVSTEVAPGTGLGLHIVRTLVSAMDGTVAAERNPDRGSTFTVRLPAARG
jgi:EAL domain-containing protein (putative c-di-GMP-specific phosphodiesterase class I)/signal transduction histidine kinase